MTKFDCGGSDMNNVSGEVRCDVLNDSSETIRLVRVAVCGLNASGDIVGHTGRNEHMMALGPGESLTIEPGFPYFERFRVGSAINRIGVKVFIERCARDFVFLGEHPLEARPGMVQVVRGTIRSTAVDQNVAVIVNVEHSNGGAEAQVQVRCGLVNVSDRQIPKAVLKVDLIDDEGAVVGSQDSEVEIAAHGAECIDTGVWGLKSSQLRGARIRLYLSIYRVVGATVSVAEGILPGAE